MMNINILVKRNWLIQTIVLAVLISIILPISSCAIFKNHNDAQTDDLGLTPSQFELLDTTVHEYLYEKYPFTRNTEFAIGYERVDTIIDDVLPEFLLVDAYAMFSIPPVVIRAIVYNDHVKIISETTTSEEEELTK